MTITMICRCGDEYEAREADIARGWAMSCSKSCAAKKRAFGGKRAKRKDGLPLNVSKKKVKRRNQYATRGTPARELDSWEEMQNAIDSEHPFSDEALGQW